MPNLAEMKPENRFMGLFVGPSGCGKTCAEISFCRPGDSRIIEVLDFDGRIGGALGATWLTNDLRKLVNYTYYPPRDPSFLTNLDMKLNGILMAGKVGQPTPQTVILDSMTSQCFATLTMSVPLTHADKKGRHIGGVPMIDPQDYGMESQVAQNVLSFLRSIPVNNVIVSAHVIPLYGREDPEDRYSPSIVIGEKLSLRDKISANIGIYFDHVFRFDKRMMGNQERYYVKFRSEIARTSYPWLPEGEHDITGKNFFEFMYSFKPKEVTA